MRRFEMRCDEVMTREVERVRETDATLVAAEKMRRQNIGFLPVCDDDDRVVGVVTDRDIAIRLVAEDLPGKTPVRSVMSAHVVTCRPEDNLQVAEHLMAEKQKSRIVCTDMRGRLAGVISLADIAAWEEERAAETLRGVTDRERAMPRT